MSRIKTDVERCMDGLAKTDSILTSSFMFPPDFIGFQGHFPTKKVLPGTCQIQCALSIIEKATEKRVNLKEIIRAKYIAPIFPEDTINCTVSGVSDSDNEFICRVRIAKGLEKVSELTLRVILGDPR